MRFLALIFLMIASLGTSRTPVDGTDPDSAARLEREDLAARTYEFCARNMNPDNQPFSSQEWMNGSLLERGAMAWGLFCYPNRYLEKSKAELRSLLGKPVEAQDDILVYRIHRQSPVIEKWIPPPPGHERVPDGYDLVFVFAPDPDRCVGAYFRVAFEPTTN